MEIENPAFPRRTFDGLYSWKLPMREPKVHLVIDPKIKSLVARLNALREEVREVDPICEYFLEMCKMALMDAEQKKRPMN